MNHHNSPHAEVEIYDTTLRDGTQAAGMSLTVDDKLVVARLIDELGVDYIEGGWPGTTPKDDEFFARATTELDLEHAVLVAFGSTCRARVRPSDDPQLAALLAAGTEVVCIVGKASAHHVTEALRIDLATGLQMVEDSVRYLVGHGRRVFFDAEHFFDGYRDNPEFSVEVLRAATGAGAERVVLCDTNGGTMPDVAERVVAEVGAMLPGVALGVHFHDDAACAVANSLAAVRAGARQVQGCINGYGERPGNADLCAVIPNLALKMGHRIRPAAHLDRLTGVAHRVAEAMNVPLNPRHPYVGSSAFAHKAGLHTSGLARLDHAYEHIDPAVVGNDTRMLVSELMGRATVLSISQRHGWGIDADTAEEVVDRVKAMEHLGYQFEVADGSFELLVRNVAGATTDLFDVEWFNVSVRQSGGVVSTEASVELMVAGDRVTATRRGDGPVNALDRALRAALVPSFPEVERIRLTDYRVQDLDTLDGTAARVRVRIECSDGERTWATVGVHQNIIEASWEALTDGVTIGLLRSEATTPAGVGGGLALMRPGSLAS